MSVPESVKLLGAFAKVSSVRLLVTGASFVDVTVIATVAGAENKSPSLTAKVKLSGP